MLRRSIAPQAHDEPMSEEPSRNAGGLSYARLLVAVGELARAEREVHAVLSVDAEDASALGLLAKIKHVRGALTEAIACWVHALGDGAPNARMHLVSMLELTRDPERGAGEFVAVGRYQLARKPLAYLELDEAYRLFIARRPAEARAECKRVALRHRHHDPALFKLAVLADALFAELSGDIADAAHTLEVLGKERGFEADFDRIVTLAELYERLGTPADLRAALNICRHLERTVPVMSVRGRIAILHRRLGESEEAARYEALHLAAFEERMHTITPEEAMQVASTRYVPIAWLERARWRRGMSSLDREALSHVLWEATQGRRPAQLVEPGAGASPIETKYAAELALRDADDARARMLVTAALREDPGDAHLLERVLGVGAAPSWIQGVLADPSIGAPAEEALRSAIELDPRSFRAWRALARVLASRGIAPEKHAAMQARASALEVAAGWRTKAIGRVLAAAVYRFVGKTRGIIHEIWVSREPVLSGRGGRLRSEAILGNLTDDMKRAVRATFVAVREYARATFPHLTEDLSDYDYTFRITKDDEPSSGSSAELPTALAFLSVFLQRPVPQDLAFTGAVVADAHDVLVLRRIGDADHKVKGAYHRDLRALVLPEENRQDLASSHRVPASVSESMCRYAARLDDAMRIAFGDEIER